MAATPPPCAGFVRMHPTYIMPMHCTGEVFIAEALRLMPQKIVQPCVGTTPDAAASRAAALRIEPPSWRTAR